MLRLSKGSKETERQKPASRLRFADPVNPRTDVISEASARRRNTRRDQASDFSRMTLTTNAADMEPIDYLNPRLPDGLRHVVMPVVEATAATLAGYGHLVDDAATCVIEIVRWPAVRHPGGRCRNW